ncbi:MAG TPA: hypothetical protein EYG68_02655 [Leucothrix mucor]|nr:hypothetical protein [Leucothrix mucor]
MNTKTTTQTKNKFKPPLWFWIAVISISLITLSSATLNLAKSSRLNITAKQNQKPLIQQRNELLESSDFLQSNWLKTLNPLAKNIQGDLVWSTQQQQGVMRFNHLPKLSAKQSYHLWIYDLEHSVKEPISATEFQPDLRVKKDFLVAILPKQNISKPYKFVLILETQAQPDQVLLLAQP